MSIKSTQHAFSDAVSSVEYEITEYSGTKYIGTLRAAKPATNISFRFTELTDHGGYLLIHTASSIGENIYVNANRRKTYSGRFYVFNGVTFGCSVSECVIGEVEYPCIKSSIDFINGEIAIRMTRLETEKQVEEFWIINGMMRRTKIDVTGLSKIELLGIHEGIIVIGHEIGDTIYTNYYDRNGKLLRQSERIYAIASSTSGLCIEGDQKTETIYAVKFARIPKAKAKSEDESNETKDSAKAELTEAKITRTVDSSSTSSDDESDNES